MHVAGGAMIAPAAALILLAGSSVRAASLPGVYVTDQMEMAGALDLQKNGHFRYQFDYGAASESAEGDWTFDGSTVRLTSNPMPKQPDFALVRDDPAPEGQVYVAVEDSSFGAWSPLTVEMTLDGIDRPVLAYADDDGRVAPPEGHRILAVKMLMPVYEAGGAPVSLTSTSGHRLLFRLEPNDMGEARFNAEPLTLDGSAMVMHRYDTEIVFRRSRK
jgi:hypothetical protein